MAGLLASGATLTADAGAQAPPQTNNPPGKVSKKAAAAHARAVARAAGIIATLPGFELLPDGGSRLFVEMTKAATVTEKREGRLITYVIQGARVDHRNNENVLETVHFNTPVTRARLLPVRGNLVFSVELRADVPSVWRTTESSDGQASVLQIDFPKGAYLPPGEYDPATDAATLPRGNVAMTQPGKAQPAPAPAPAPATPQGPPAP